MITNLEETIARLIDRLPAVYPGELDEGSIATVLYALEAVIDAREPSADLIQDATDLLHKIRTDLALPGYQLPDPQVLAAAVDDVLAYETDTSPRLARVMCTVAAAAVRDTLTHYDHSKPYDAAGLELRLYSNGTVSAPGTYWTASGQRRHMATGPNDIDGQAAVFDLNEWVTHLNASNRSGWEPLCTPLGTGGDHTVYRLDLAQAAALPPADR